MSHFTVLVIGPDPDEQLLPFHEFECTGLNNEFVKDVDRTEEVLNAYAREKVHRLRAPSGSLISPFDDRFYRDPTPEEDAVIGKLAGTGGSKDLSWESKDWKDGRGYRTKVRFVPDGFEEVEVAMSEIQSLTAFVRGDYGWKPVPEGSQPDLDGAHKYGYCLVDKDGKILRCIGRTNPNAKWDWYAIGGRWTGFFPVRKGAHGMLGRQSLMGERAEPGTADQLAKGDVDWDRLRDEAEERALKLHDLYHPILESHPGFEAWDSVRERIPDINEARRFYGEQAAVKAFHRAGNDSIFDMLENYACSRDQRIVEARAGAGVPFAVLHNGVWLERGQMGWWGCVSGEQDKMDWSFKVKALIESLPDDTLLTLVDCHI